MPLDRAAQARGLGQSLWHDGLARGELRSGALPRLVEAGAITGVTARATDFEDPAAPIADVQLAADLLRPVWEKTQGKDGYVSLDVPPNTATDESATVAAAKRLAKECARQNVMIALPGTPAGIAAFRRLTEEGVNVNVTQLFSLEQYEPVAQAWIAALRTRMKKGFAVHTLASVASLSVNPVDRAIDTLLEKKAAAVAISDPVNGPAARDDLLSLRSKAAIAQCKLAYVRFRELFASPFDDCRAKGARPQRLLWTATTPKTPSDPDLLYVESLLGPDTIHALSPITLAAFLDHASVRTTTILEQHKGELETLRALERYDIDVEAICARLQLDGVANRTIAGTIP